MSRTASRGGCEPGGCATGLWSKRGVQYGRNGEYGRNCGASKGRGATKQGSKQGTPFECCSLHGFEPRNTIACLIIYDITDTADACRALTSCLPCFDFRGMRRVLVRVEVRGRQWSASPACETPRHGGEASDTRPYSYIVHAAGAFDCLCQSRRFFS